MGVWVSAAGAQSRRIECLGGGFHKLARKGLARQPTGPVLAGDSHLFYEPRPPRPSRPGWAVQSRGFSRRSASEAGRRSSSQPLTAGRAAQTGEERKRQKNQERQREQTDDIARSLARSAAASPPIAF